MPREIPECPEHLADEAREEWYRVVTDLHSSGVLTRVDRAALAAYCSAFALWAKAERAIQQTGEILRSKDSDKVYTNPYVHIRNSALRQMHAFASEFGLTPASRSRIHAAPQQGSEVDELDAFLEGAS